MLLGIDIGGTALKSALLSEKNHSIEFINNQSEPTQAKERGGRGLLKRVLEIIKECQSKHDISGVAISTAGMVDGETFEIVYANENIPKYKGINFVEGIREETGLLSVVENDVNAATLGEWKYGAGKNSSSILCLAIGTGVGGGMILNERLIRGATDSAGEVGYMTLENSTFEKLASTQQLVRSVQMKKNNFSIDGKEIFELAKKGDKDCQQEIERFINYLCMGINNCACVINPEKVILGGGIMEQKSYLLPRINREINNIFKERTGKPEIVAAALGNSACLAGVYWLFNSYYDYNHMF
ncbi:MAG: ROK family protein [Enterococcaceae bacterium]|jgi:predicted NBD/HSP70 family sugar kinase|nr:ROK family protein [Enterococcaceae bacterium]MCI1919314.1 ROK family protein [Enterococcaceae bacterium]